jgi:Ser/Thr protein kinase RdoA (MazF antagonist)
MIKPLDESVYAVAAREALRAFLVGPAEVHFLCRGENVIYRVVEHATGETFVLRLHRPGYHALDALKSECIWTGALDAAGIHVPELVRTVSQDYHVAVPVGASGETRWSSLVRWIEGKLLSDVLQAESSLGIRLDYFRRLGAILGETHNQASMWRPPSGFVRHNLDADGLMGERPFWGRFWDHEKLPAQARDLFAMTRDQIRGALLRYGKPASTFSMIHADLHPGNVLVTEHDLAIIDFDDAAHGWHQYDIAVALLSFGLDPDFEQICEQLLEGYRQKRPLSEDDLALLPMFMLIRQLVLIGWLFMRPEVSATAHLPDLILHASQAATDFVAPC